MTRPQETIFKFLNDLKLDGLPLEWLATETSAPKSEQPPHNNSVLKIHNNQESDFRNSLSLKELAEVAASCIICGLCETRTNVVFGEGNVHSPLIAFVGEGPGEEEDRFGRPFVGKAGQLLNSAIKKGLGLNREDLYICNVIKCRPPENRTPLPTEVAACSPYLFRQLELIKPKVIVTLGQTPQLTLEADSKEQLSESKLANLGITKLRGQWRTWRGIPLMPTFHPAYILRNPSAKKPFWEDLQQVMKFLGITPNVQAETDENSERS